MRALIGYLASCEASILLYTCRKKSVRPSLEFRSIQFMQSPSFLLRSRDPNSVCGVPHLVARVGSFEGDRKDLVEQLVNHGVVPQQRQLLQWLLFRAAPRSLLKTRRTVQLRQGDARGPASAVTSDRPGPHLQAQRSNQVGLRSR